MTGGPLRLGLIGCGRLAEAGYLPAIGAVDEVRLAAVADPDPMRRRRLRGLARVSGVDPTPYEGAGELVEGGAVDAVVIASPPGEHVAQATAAAGAGLATLVEKPPAPGSAGARALAELDPAPWIGFNRRFMHGRALRPRAEVADVRMRLTYRRDSWRPVAVDDGALTDLAPHLVDLALAIAGPGEVEVIDADVGVERVEFELRVGDAAVSALCANDRPHRELVLVRDSRGRRIASSRAGGPIRALTSRLPGRPHPLVASLGAQLSAFARGARGERCEPLATAEDGLQAMRVVDELARHANGATA